MEWRVYIKGDSYDLEELSKSLNSPELCVTKEGKSFILKSKDFNCLNNSEDVENEARTTLALINGAARLTLGMLKPLIVAGVEKVNEDGTRELAVFRPIIYSVRRRGKADAIPNCVAIARENGNVAKALQLLSVGPSNWVSLYNIEEIVEDDIGQQCNIAKEKANQKEIRCYMEKQGWAPEGAISRFAGTANKFSAIGYEARHAVDRGKPLKNPMTFSEAVSLIESILRKWINSKKSL